MPYVLETIPEGRETIVRPVVYNIIDQLALMTIMPRDIRVIFPGQAEVSYQIGSTLDAKNDTPPNTFVSQAQLSVRVEENYVDERVLSTAVTMRQNNPVFGDADIGIDIRPVYSYNELVFNFTYRTPDQTTARQFRNDLKMRRSMGRVENLHEIAYSYGIPFQFFPILGELFTLRQNQGGDSLDFNTWFKNHASNKFTIVTNLAGNEPSAVLRETQVGIVGWFDTLVTVDEAERANNTGAYNVNFTYRIQFDKPIACFMRYPIVVHNQLVPQQYLVNNNIYQLKDRPRAPAWTRSLFDKFTGIYPQNSGIDGVQTPDNDDWRPKQVYPATSSLMTMMIQVDPKDPTNICSLFDLGAYSINPDILAFLQASEYSYLTNYNASVVNLELFENDSPLGPNTMTVDSQLNVMATFPMNITKTYHLRISLVNDLLGLPETVQDRTRKSGVACLQILNTLEGKLPYGPQLPSLIGGTIVSRADFLSAGQRINSYKVPLKSNVEYVFLATVGNFLIETQRGS